jgi:hypothetical protein
MDKQRDVWIQESSQMHISAEECHSEMKETCKHLSVFLGKECSNILPVGAACVFISLSFKVNWY